MCSDAWVEVTNICRKTVKDLNYILMELEEFQTCVLPVDQNKRKYSICTTRNKTKQTCSFWHTHYIENDLRQTPG